MTEDDLKLERINEARQLSVSFPVLMPLLQKRQASAFGKLMANHRDSRHQEQQNIISELFVIDSIMKEINAKIDNLK
jgi:hypothetical protein